MIGAIIGDVIGSAYEFNNVRSKNFKAFTSKTTFTDDTVCTIAFMDYFLHAEKYDEENAVKYLHAWTNRYPNAGYGGRFRQWVLSKNPKPYNSFGNGSAMRISSVGWVANNLTELGELSNTVTKITHNHPEGIKGAEAIAIAIYLALHGATKEDIKERMVNDYYPEISSFSFENLVKTYSFSEICQKSVPQAIYCFLISDSLEDTIRNCVAIGGDCDTTGAMAGAIAEAFYQKDKVSEFEDKFMYWLVDPEVEQLVKRFHKTIGSKKYEK